MRNYRLAVPIMIAWALPLLLPAQSLQDKKPAAIIFDSDIGPDYDDVGALAMLHAMADKGECRILATIASDKHIYAAPVLSVLNTYFRRPGTPIGIVRGKAVDISAPQKWDSIIVSRYPHAVKGNSQAHDATILYRKILAKQPDNSVTIVTIGFLTNMANLLLSTPDRYSKLNGKELVARKVKRLVSMAACFDKKLEPFKEYNVKMDTASSRLVFDQWPTTIVFSGFEIGARIFTGLPITKSNIRNSPVKDVFSISIPLDPSDKNGRMSWDETAVLVAVRGHAPYFDMVKGRIVYYPDGSTGWDNTGTRDFYLVQKMPVDQMEKVLNDLISHQPRK